jgi:ATP-dependent Lon protease
LSLRNISSDEAANSLKRLEDPGHLADMAISVIQPKLSEAQKVLETYDSKERLAMVSEILRRELKVLKIQARLDSEAQGEMARSEREFYLKGQLRAISRELGDGRYDEANEYRERLKIARVPKIVAIEAERQLKRLEATRLNAAESASIRAYLDWIVDLPWAVSTHDRLDLAEAKKVLDLSHYGLRKVKDLVLEYLAVMKLSRRQKSPIICFLGQPGVGKTSLGQSIAKAMGRKFVRFSLGGLKDEAEIKGHRRTYIGSAPGRIIQGLKIAGSNNPVFMLDEVDKIGSDFRGDPAAALLEVLDAEQNANFIDHYLDLPFDLSNVMFIATANHLDSIPQALEDRMEVIRLSGYSTEEKVAIAKKHLIPRLVRDHGLSKDFVTIKDPAIVQIITSYAQEAGVRDLERKLAAICRRVARDVAEGQTRPQRIVASRLLGILGPPKFLPEPERLEGQIGVATGLAWTMSGGEIMYVEVRTMVGKGGLSLTGQLGEIMRESAQTVLAFIRAHATEFGLARDFFENLDIHVHVPAGDVPKEGPSAGVTLLIATLSALLDRPVPKNLAMTGEITLRGQIMAIGGLKEKALAALRAEVRRVVIPRQNDKDLTELSASLRKQVEFIEVSDIEELMAVVFPDFRFKQRLAGVPPRPRRRPKPRRGTQARP